MDCQLMQRSVQKHYQSQLQCGIEPQQQQQFTQFYVWGSNEYGQVGFKIKNDDNGESNAANYDHITTPKLLTYNIMVKSVACGQIHTHILSQQGFVYSMGSNKDGRLGLGLTYQQLQKSTSPRLIESLQQVKAIECGDSHTVALDRQFQVYGWGLADSGALGIRQTRINSPLQISVDNQQIKDISCGSNHSAFITVDGAAFTCGLGRNGQLGTGAKQLIEFQPESVNLGTSNDKVKQVSCGSIHTLFLMESGQIFSCGENGNGQLGLGHTNNAIIPQLVQRLTNIQIRKISAGSLSSSALTYSGELYVFGKFNEKTFFLPERVPLTKQLIDIRSKYDVSTAIDTDNKAWIWASQSSQNMKLPLYPQPYDQLQAQKVSKLFVGQSLVFAMGLDANEDVLKAKKSLKKLFVSNSNQKKKKCGLKKLKQQNPNAKNTFEQRSSSICASQNSHRKKSNKIAIISQLNTNLSISPISRRSNKTPKDPKVSGKRKGSNSCNRQNITTNSNNSHYYNYKTQLDVRRLQSSESQTIQDEEEFYQEDDIIRQLNISSCTVQTPKPPKDINLSNSSQLQKENQQLKMQLEQEQFRSSELEKQLKNVKVEQRTYQEDMEDKLGSLGQQMEDLFNSYSLQSEELQSHKEKSQISQEQYQKLKEQLVHIEEILIEKEDELSKYQQLGTKLLETETYIDQIIADKDQREEELLNKMSTLADHYHKEKEKNGKLMSEMLRLNETLERLDQHIRLLQNEKCKANEAVDSLQDELAREKVDCNKGKYNMFINKIPINNNNDGQSSVTQSTDRSQIVSMQADDSGTAKESKQSLKDRIGRSDSLSKLLKSYNLYERQAENNQVSSVSVQQQQMPSQSNNLNKSYQQESIERSAQKNVNASYDNIMVERVQKINNEEKDRKREDYNSYVLKNLEKKAQKASAEKRNQNQLYQSADSRYKQSLPKMQEQESPSFDLNQTNHSINLNEVQREAFRDVSQFVNINSATIQSEQSQERSQKLNINSNSNLCSNKKQLASMVDNEMREVSALMSQLSNFNSKREELQNRLQRVPNHNNISP